MGTPHFPKSKIKANETNEAKGDGDIATRASPVEGLLMNESVSGNGEVVVAKKYPILSPKI